MEQCGHHRNISGKSSLIKHSGAMECDLLSYIHPSPHCLSVACRFYFYLSNNTEMLLVKKKFKQQNSRWVGKDSPLSAISFSFPIAGGQHLLEPFLDIFVHVYSYLRIIIVFL